MRCPRCRGLMAPYDLVDTLDSLERVCEAWRCVNCGELMDRVLLENRLNPPRVTARSRRRWTGGLAA